MKWLVGLLVGFLGWFVLPLIRSEFADWCPRFGEWIIRGAARRLPREHQDRYNEEWLGELDAVPGKLSKLVFAIGVLGRGRAISNALQGSDRPTRRQPEWRSPVAKRYRAIAIGLAFSDAACVAIGLGISYFAQYGSKPMVLSEALAVVAFPLLWIVVFQTFNLYSPQHLSAQDEFRRVIGATGVGMVLLVMVSFWSNFSFSRGWIGLTWLATLLLELVARRAWRWHMHRLRLQGVLAYRTLVVGSPVDARRLMESLQANGSGFKLLGYVQASPSTTRLQGDLLPIVGTINQLRGLIQTYAADCVFVVSTAVTVDDMSRIAQAARLEGAEVRMSVNLQRTLTSRLSVLPLGNDITLQLRPARLSANQATIKRAFDLAVASSMLLITLPILVATAIAIRFNSRGPVFFHQERVTKDGRIFRMHKFRTMRSDNDTFHLDTSVPFFKLESDPRLTTVGKLIRRYSFDELPQLWNVIKGEMSIVGPRPLPAEQVAANQQLLSPRNEVPAGLTGWWQINGRSTVTPEEALRLDLFYIENWSLSLDLYILLKTFVAVTVAQGAY